MVEVLVVSSWASRGGAGWRTGQGRCRGGRRRRANGGSVDSELGGNGWRGNARSTRSYLAEQLSLDARPESPEKRWAAAQKIRATVTARADLSVIDVQPIVFG